MTKTSAEAGPAGARAAAGAALHPRATAPDTPKQPGKRPHVVIVGGGFGGLSAARALAGQPLDVTLIDQRNHHIFQPLLYQVATATLATSEIAWPIRSLLREARNVRTVLATVEGIDRTARQVQIAGQPPLDYDWLILATGVQHAYFGHDEWAASAPGLKTIEDATRIRRQLLLAFERAEAEPDPARRQALLTFVIVGGGPTGVELAGSIAALARHTLPRDFRAIDTHAARVVLVEAGPKLLGPYPAALSDYAARALGEMGVEVALGQPVSACDAGGVTFGDRRLPARTVIWAAGVKASPAARWTGAAADRAGRVEVTAELCLPAAPEIFAIGDTAAVKDAQGRPVPGIAPAAKQQGKHAAQLILARLAGDNRPRPFRYRHMGNLAQIGHRSAVIDFGRLQLRGTLAWWIWGVAHVYFLIGNRARLAVAISWLWSGLRKQRSARLITQGHSEPVAEPLPVR